MESRGVLRVDPNREVRRRFRDELLGRDKAGLCCLFFGIVLILDLLMKLECSNE